MLARRLVGSGLQLRDFGSASDQKLIEGLQMAKEEWMY